MSLSMYEASIPVFTRMLGNLSVILDKAAAHAEAQGIDPGYSSPRAWRRTCSHWRARCRSPPTP